MTQILFSFLTPIYNDAPHGNEFLLYFPAEVKSMRQVFDIAQNLAIYSATFFLVVIFALVVRYILIRYKEYKCAPKNIVSVPLTTLDYCILLCNVIIGISAIGFISFFNPLVQMLISNPTCF